MESMERIEDTCIMEKEKEKEKTLEVETDSNQNNNNNNCAAVFCAEVKENGHLSPTDSLNSGENGQTEAAASGPAVTVTTPIYNSLQPLQQVQNTNSVVSPSISHQNSNGNHQGHSPNCCSPNPSNQQPSSPRDTSPQNGTNPTSPQTHQHVVHVHVNPGETFSVRVGDQIQHIQGPATVRMVSNNGPPLPMPMQVPPGHMVQQIVDEHGILTHIILSQQPPGMPVGGQPLTGGPNNNAPQYYSSYGPHYPTHPYPNPHHHTHHGASPHVHTGAPTHPHGTPPPANCNSHTSGPVHQPGPSQQNSMDSRASRQKEKVRRKYVSRVETGFYNQRQPPRRANNKQKSMSNGDVNNYSGMATADPGQDALMEEERKIMQQHLSNMPDPVVSEVEARSALIQLAPPEVDQNEFEIDSSEFRYTLLLSDKGKDGKYKLVYSGDATEITLKDLKPATEYHLRNLDASLIRTIFRGTEGVWINEAPLYQRILVYTSLDDLKGNSTEAVQFTTNCCEPDPPQSPKLSSKTKTSITLKWGTTSENGAKVSSYTLECDKGTVEGFVEVYNGLQRQHRVSKLQPSSKYIFRVAAINSVGKSHFCEPVTFYTSGSVPPQPDPPMLSEAYVTALTISWIKRPNEDGFFLQMEDEYTGHGFIAAYNGPNLSYKVKNLRRNTEYKFRLAAINDEGQSKWSDAVSHRTKPDRPKAPPKPQIKGKIHSNNFRVVWEAPKDDGGADVTMYIAEIDDGRGYKVLYEGPEREHVCDHLVPGQMYMIRVACCNLGGKSDFSEPCGCKTQAVIPGQCQAPKLQGKPKATSLHLRWGYPETDGGSIATEFSVQMVTPDNTSREVYKGRDLDCIVAGLSPGRPYLFQVRAFNKVGGGPWSEPLEVVSGPGVPDPPKAPLVNCRSPHSAMVCWEAPVNNGATITDYRLEWQLKADVTDFSQLYFGSGLSFEVKGLTAATLYSFRVQAINSAGAGPYSSVGTCVTPPSSPSPVISVRSSSTATTVSLSWKEPNCNGSDIIAYNIDLGDKQFSVGAVNEYTLEDLLPEMSYKIRIQAVNGIGVGPYSSAIRAVTRPLPPSPAKLECICAAPNSLKLKWGDGRNMDLLTYTVEMERDDGFQVIYQGAAYSYKVSKLSETTSYNFRLYASNIAGSGPYSDIYTFTTIKAQPPVLKAPRVSEVTLHSCMIDWQPCKRLGSDGIAYVLQLQSKEQEYKQIYRGPSISYHLQNLHPKTEYSVRVCAIRLCEDGSEVVGTYSPPYIFSSQSLETLTTMEVSKITETKIVETKQLTDQQWAMIILFVFVAIAVLVAYVVQHIIAYTSSHTVRHE